MEWIVEFLLRSSVLLSAVLLLSLLIRLSAAERHGFLLAGLLGVALLATISSLGWQIPISLSQTAVGTVGSTAAAGVESLVQVAAQMGALAGPEQTPASVVGAGVESIDGWLLGYGLIALLLLARLLYGWHVLGRKIEHLPTHQDGQLPVAVPAEIRLKVADCASPWTWGHRHPVLVLPAGFSQWSRQKQTEAMIHELAHIRRRDCLTQMLAHLLAILFWFQPLVWVARRRLARLAEQASDDVALSDGAAGPDYAQSLLDIARANKDHGARTLAGALTMSRHPLNGRIDAILDPTLRRTPLGMVRFAAILLVVFLYTVPVAAVTPRSAVPQDSPILPILKVAPSYPVEAQAQKLEGTVVVEFEVTAQGRTRNIQIVEESSPGVFGAAAVAAVAQFRYLAARAAGVAVASEGIRNRITFALTADGAEPQVSADPVASRSALQANLAAGSDWDATLVQGAIAAVRSEKNRNQDLLIAVIEQAEQEAERTGSGDAFVQAATLATSLGENGHAIYCLMRASDLHVSHPKQARTQLVQVLLAIERLDDARTLFEADAASDQTARAWLSYLEQENARRGAVYDLFSSKLLDQ